MQRAENQACLSYPESRLRKTEGQIERIFSKILSGDFKINNKNLTKNAQQCVAFGGEFKERSPYGLEILLKIFRKIIA